MGVKTKITLDELNKIFPQYFFISIIPTSSGIIDTTYIVSTSLDSYILKHYERDISNKIENDKKLLFKLNSIGLNVPLCIDNNSKWFLYKKLDGLEPKVVKLYHIVALARFLSKLHKYSYNKNCKLKFIDSYDMNSIMRYIKLSHFSSYKKLELLKNIDMKNDGFIHGDLFKDNTVFKNQHIGVFDFIDSGCGDFRFDCAVSIVGFGKLSKSYINLFLNTYNQTAPKKVIKSELYRYIEIASKFYASLRIYKYKSTKKAKKLISPILDN